MARIFITGSTDGLGRLAAENLLAEGHQVTVHARDDDRLLALQTLIDDGAGVVVGDLADLVQVREVAEQANSDGAFDTVIHNAGVIRGPALLPVNVVAPYLLSATMQRAHRLIFLSSGLHHGGHPTLDGLDWSGEEETASYADAKLMVTAFAAALARHWPQVLTHAVDPGWVPTRMGGASATGDLREGTRTQEWLAVTDDPAVEDSGGYWHHQRREEPHEAVHDEKFHERLVSTLAQVTGVHLP